MSAIGRVVLIVAVATVGVLLASQLLRVAREDPAIEGRNSTSLYNHVHPGEEIPDEFRDLSPRDAIRPIYDPQFVGADEAGWHEQALVIGLEINGDVRAYPVSELQNVANHTANGTPIAVVVDAGDGQSWTVFSRTLDDGAVVELEFTENGELADVTTSTTFHISRGTGISGPLASQTLHQLPGFTSFAQDYFTFYPQGRIWSEE